MVDICTFDCCVVPTPLTNVYQLCVAGERVYVLSEDGLLAVIFKSGDPLLDAKTDDDDEGLDDQYKSKVVVISPDKLAAMDADAHNSSIVAGSDVEEMDADFQPHIMKAKPDGHPRTV